MISRAMRDQVRAMLRPIRGRVDNMIARGVVTLVNSAVKMQTIQVGVQEGETKDGVERFQPFGHHSVPLEGAEAVLVFVGGDRNLPIAVVVDDRRHRPTGWSAGEAGTFNAHSAMMHHRADGTTEITGGGTAEPLATKADLDELKAAFAAWVVSPNDGGAALKTELASWSPLGTTKLKGE